MPTLSSSLSFINFVAIFCVISNRLKRSPPLISFSASNPDAFIDPLASIAKTISFPSRLSGFILSTIIGEARAMHKSTKTAIFKSHSSFKKLFFADKKCKCTKYLVCICSLHLYMQYIMGAKSSMIKGYSKLKKFILIF